MILFPLILRIASETLYKFYFLKIFSKSLIKSWLHALPLYHFLRGDCKPFVDIEVPKTIDYGNWKWWGLSNINVREIRRHIDKRFDLHVSFF